MTLRDKAAAALDHTHNKAQFGLRDTQKVRAIVAAWLDGQKVKQTIVRKSVAYLEMIDRSHCATL